ncbi:MAG TPA: hypothetical protein VJS18_21145 [Paraburkholderia sp.]|nr:hypothetical protein [Paraburkholderia sp.]
MDDAAKSQPAKSHRCSLCGKRLSDEVIDEAAEHGFAPMCDRCFREQPDEPLLEPF